MKHLFAVILFVILLIIALIVGAQNEQIVEVNYLLARQQLTVSALMAILLFSGFVLGMLAFSVVWFKLKWQNNQLQKKLNHHKPE